MKRVARTETEATYTDARLETVELPVGAVVHYSCLEGGVAFFCRKERVPGDYWSQYQAHVTCPQCAAMKDVALKALGDVLASRVGHALNKAGYKKEE